MKNSELYAWRIDVAIPEPLICLGVFRVMDYSYRRGPKSSRVIFRGPFYTDSRGFNAAEFIMNWPIDCTIQIREVENGRPDDYANGHEVARFEQCIPIRSWIPRLIATRPEETTDLEAFIDVECIAQWTYPK